MDLIWQTELLKNQKNNIFSIDKINWWLLKFSNLYKEIYEDLYSKHWFKFQDGTTARLPPFGKVSREEQFLNLFDALNEISQFHRNEEYFKRQLLAFHQVKDSQLKLKNWLVKNSDLGADKYACFLLEYLDYDQEDKIYHLKVFVQSLNELNIYVNRQDFSNTIMFLKFFNDLYWNIER